MQLNSKITLNVLQKNVANSFLYKIFNLCIERKYDVRVFMVTAIWP